MDNNKAAKYEAASDVPRWSGEVYTHLEAVREALVLALSRMTELENDIQPVLKPAHPSPEDGQLVPAADTPLGGDVAQLVSKARLLAGYVQYIRGRVDL